MAAKDLWEKLPPKQKSMAMLGLVGLIIVAVALLMPTGGSGDTGGQRQQRITNILTDSDPRALGIDGIGVELRKVRTENRELRMQLAHLKTDSVEAMEARLRKMQDLVTESQTQITVIRGEVDRLRQQKPTMVTKTVTVPSAGNSPGERSHGPRIRPATAVPPMDVDSLFSVAPTNIGGKTTSVGPAPKQGSSLSIRVIDSESSAPTESPGEAEPESVFLPTGSILTGTLMNGLDAPTGRGTRNEPHPVLVRIKHDAILPNRYAADYRECFVVGGGYGDLSTERAYLRSERLSCVREDGGVIDVTLDAYATGEDGKVGVAGKLVSKQGQVLARAMAAGMMQGFASVFQSYPVPVVQTDPGSSTLWQNNLSSDAVASGVFQGAGTALEKLADFYLDQAEQMFPVIEVNAGRRVNFVVTTGRRVIARS